MTDSPAHDVPMEDRHPMTGNRMSGSKPPNRPGPGFSRCWIAAFRARVPAEPPCPTVIP